MWGLLEMGVGDDLCPQEKAREACWMESSRKVNTMIIERIRGISIQLGRKRPSTEQLGEQSPRMRAQPRASQASFRKHEQEFALGLLPCPAQPALVGETESFLQLVLRRSRASPELDSSPPQKAVCS